MSAAWGMKLFIIGQIRQTTGKDNSKALEGFGLILGCLWAIYFRLDSDKAFITPSVFLLTIFLFSLLNYQSLLVPHISHPIDEQEQILLHHQSNPQDCYYKSLDSPDYARELPLVYIGKGK
jgi:hypothetical protein